MNEPLVKKAEEIEKEISSEFSTASKKEGLLDKVIDFFFSNDLRRYLVLILLFGAALRFIFVRNISALGDEMVHGPHAIGFLHSGLISTFAHSPLFFYLTDIAFKIFGVTMFSSRFVSFFYGSLTILVVYLISSKIFDKRVGIISAFLLAVSYYAIRYTLIEMDVGLIFFVMLAFYFFIISIEKGKFPIVAAILIGLATLMKTLSLFFVPAFILSFFIFNKGKQNVYKNIKKSILFGAIILLIFSPVIVHNYFWYQDSKMVDTYFAQYFFPSLRYHWAGQLGFDKGVSENLPHFFSSLGSMSKFMFNYDPIIISLGIIGIIFSFIYLKSKRKYLAFMLLFEAIPFVLLLLSNWLHTHYSNLIPMLVIFAAVLLNSISSKLSQKIRKLGYKKTIFMLLFIILIFQMIMLWPHLSSRGALSKTRAYAIENMDKSSIVLTDSRIYTGRVAWLFFDFHYLEASYFNNILALNQNISGEQVPIKLYFIECARDDCGWGTITPGALNDSMENFVSSISRQSTLEKTILGGGGYDEETGEPYFNIYSAVIYLNPQIISAVDSTHYWFYYPVNYQPKEASPDSYDVYGTFDNAIYLIVCLITILSIVLAILAPILPIYSVSKQK